ncbi:hypothetical protein LINPERPRIM_LOCUS43630 [Linum perenne]
MANSRDQANEECPKQMNSSSNQANKEGPKQMEEGSKQQIEEDSKQMAISSDHAEKEAISDNDEDDISKENLFMTRKRMQRKLSSGSSCYLSAQVHILETSCRKASKLKGASYLLMKDDDIMMSLISPLCLGGVGVNVLPRLSGCRDEQYEDSSKLPGSKFSPETSNQNALELFRYEDLNLQFSFCSLMKPLVL